MELDNRTAANAKLIPTGFGEHHMLAAVIARPTFRIEAEKLIPTPDEPWPISQGPIETPAGPFPGDVPFLSGGIDLLILGNVYQPNGDHSPDLQMEIKVGSRFYRAIDVFGDRVWEKKWGTLVQSAAEPFDVMPLTYENAYGGTLELENGRLVCPTNPEGKGFYLTAEQAAGQPLPNLEDPCHPIESFEDQPDPIGTAPYPAEGALAMMNAVEVDLESDPPGLKRIKPSFFNRAHPRMVLEPSERPRAGEVIEVTYIRPDGSLRFTMPDLSYHAHVQLEDRSYLFPLHLDQIGILAEDLRVFLGFRVAFKYRLVPLERRLATLYEGAAPDAVPDHYTRVWEE